MSQRRVNQTYRAVIRKTHSVNTTRSIRFAGVYSPLCSLLPPASHPAIRRRRFAKGCVYVYGTLSAFSKHSTAPASSLARGEYQFAANYGNRMVG